MLLAFRLAGLSAPEGHYAGEFALTQTEPSVAAPSVKNIDSDKRHDESDQGGCDGHLSLSSGSTRGGHRQSEQEAAPLLGGHICPE
jgi:hypothetical protein